MCSGALMALNVWLPSDQWRVITGLALSVLAGLVYLRLPLFAVQERALALESLGKRWSVWANRLGWFRVRGVGA
jgi:hypothetical protein